MSGEKPRLEPASNGQHVFYLHRRLYSPRDPRGGAVRRAQAAGTVRPQTLVIVPSPLLGYGLEELLQNCPADAVVLAVELDPQLAELTRSAAVSSELSGDPRLIWMLAPGDKDLDALLPRILAKRPRRTQLVALSGGFGLRASQYRHLVQRFEDEIRIFWQNAMTRVRMGRLWIRNLFRNLALLPGSVPLQALATDLPTVVVAAGPSLDDHIHQLSSLYGEKRRHLRIISVDTAVPALSAHNIRPDIVVAVESQQANAADFLADLPAIPHLICDLTAYPGTTRTFARHQLLSFVSSRFAPSALLDRLRERNVLPEGVPPLGSVGVLAVYLARRLTSGPVYFTGLDFTYDLERTHARGAPMHTLSLIRRNRLDPSPFFGMALNRPLVTPADKSGRKTRSDTVLLSYAEQLREVVRTTTGVYDLSPESGLPNGAPPATRIRTDKGHSSPAAAPAAQKPAQADPAAAPATQEAAQADRAAPGAASTKDGVGSAREVHEILDAEVLRLGELVTELRAALHRAGTAPGVSGEDYETVLPQLESCDYVYLDFPDPPSHSRAFLGRVLLSALSYQQKLDDIRTLLSRL